MPKDWDAIMREIPTPPDSDSEDILNEQSVKKNAKRVVELLNNVAPNLDRTRAGAPPMGMNRADILRDGLKASVTPHTVAEKGPENITRDDPKANAVAPPNSSESHSPPGSAGEGVLK